MCESSMTYEELLYAVESHLAVVHRDGGHYTGKHGLKKSLADATQEWYKMRTRISDREWIPVSAITPGTPVKVAVWSSSTGHTTAFYHNGFWIETYSEMPLADVTHWKQLSEPPKKAAR